MSKASKRTVIIDYTNHRGERAERTIEPGSWYFGKTEWHPEEQWLMYAFDVKKDVFRTFAQKDIHSWRPA